MSFFFVRLDSTLARVNHRQHTRVPNPVCELFRVRDGRGQENDVDMIREHDYDFFPDDTALPEL